MSTNRRVLDGVMGTVLVLAVVFMNYCDHTAPDRRVFTCDVPVCWPEPYSTVVGYLVSAAGFSLLVAGLVGDRLRSRYGVIYLVVAFALASLLVAGMKVYWELVPPTGDWLDD